MQQREFTALKTVYFSDDDFYVRVADICVHTEDTNKLTVYRNQEVVGNFVRTLNSMQAMVYAGWFMENKVSAAPKTVVETEIEIEEPDMKVADDQTEPATEDVQTPAEEVKEDTTEEVKEDVTPEAPEEATEEETTEEVKEETEAKPKRKKK